MLKIRPFSNSSQRLQFLLSVLAGGVLLASSGAQAHAADRGGSASTAARGGTIFHQRCAVCHNKQPGNDSPFGPPNLYDVFRQKRITSTEAKKIIHDGKGNMPSFGSSISDAQIHDVIAYLSKH